VRDGRAEPREPSTGVNILAILTPRVNDRRLVAGERQRFTREILPPYIVDRPVAAQGILTIMMGPVSFLCSRTGRCCAASPSEAAHRSKLTRSAIAGRIEKRFLKNLIREDVVCRRF
jgi:hypothetical protein